MGVALGSMAHDLSVAGKNLSTIWLDTPVTYLRTSFNIDTKLLKSYYKIEKELFPNSIESQRL